MSRVTKFAARDPGPSARIVGFIAHLRENGLRLGVAEADLAMSALVEIDAIQPGDSRRALRAYAQGARKRPSGLTICSTVTGWTWVEFGKKLLRR